MVLSPENRWVGIGYRRVPRWFEGRLRRFKGDFGLRSLRFVVLVLVVVLAVSLIPDLAERDWISVIVAGLLIGVLVLWYKTLKRRP